jgi:DNA replication protein DnaC
MMIPMCSLIDNLYTLRNQNAAEAADFEERIRKAKLLVIDDLGTENNQQGWIMSKVDSIISQRYDNKLATIITTNYGAAGLNETYGGRILDRMKGCCFYLPFLGQSERKPLDIKDI